MQWTTLGTNGGPVASATRAQPANLLSADGAYWLVDAGDGASDQMAKAGVSPMRLNAVLISHLHPDHFAGLYGAISRRWFLRAPSELVIYGPPGTQELVDGMLASLVPAEKIGLGLTHDKIPPAAGTVRVVTVRGGDSFRIGGITATALANTHYEPDSDTGSQSLSFRFDKDGYAIGYTGDTGPSDAVARAFSGVNLLVSEIVDMPSMIAQIDRNFPSMPAGQRDAVIQHLRTHHLTPGEVARLARTAGAGELVITHLVAAENSDAVTDRIDKEVRDGIDGKFEIAGDLDGF